LAGGGNGPEKKCMHRKRLVYVCTGILTFQEAALWNDKRL